jgi:diketogulonate reductase-like aldo/keto reductase
LKLPASKQNPSSIAIEINPTNTTTAGSAFTRKKGIIIRGGSELEQFNQLLSNPKIVELAKKIERSL